MGRSDLNRVGPARDALADRATSLSGADCLPAGPRHIYLMPLPDLTEDEHAELVRLLRRFRHVNGIKSKHCLPP